MDSEPAPQVDLLFGQREWGRREKSHGSSQPKHQANTFQRSNDKSKHKTDMFWTDGGSHFLSKHATEQGCLRRGSNQIPRWLQKLTRLVWRLLLQEDGGWSKRWRPAFLVGHLRLDRRVKKPLWSVRAKNTERKQCSILQSHPLVFWLCYNIFLTLILNF